MKTIRKNLRKLQTQLVQKIDDSLNKLHTFLEQYGFEYFNEMPPMARVKQKVRK